MATFKKLSWGEKLKKECRLIVFFILIINLFTASYYAINSDLNFHTDIARDFLLFAEIQQKKLVLIGGRAGAAGIFHGPLWNYFNFPVFWISKGNPVAQEWFWIALIIFFLIYSFKIAKKLFNTQTAYLYTLLMSVYLMPWAKEFSHPEGALLLSPLFFYTFYKYIKGNDVRYLTSHILVAGLIFQLEIAAGAPLLFMSAIYILFMQYKIKKLKHAFAFIILLIPFSSYILFDLKHNFFELKNIIIYISPHSHEHYFGFLNILKNRINYIFTAATSLIPKHEKINVIVSTIFFFLIFKIIRQKEKNNRIYFIFAYFFIGYFSISLLSKYYLLDQDFLPFIPIVMMVVASLVMSKYRNFFTPVIISVLILNELTVPQYIVSANKFIGNNLKSWKELNKIESDIFNDSNGEFGYFIYSPDKFSYPAKYAMLYGSMHHANIKADYFQKKTVTYVISEPPAAFDPFAKYWTSDWWVQNSIKIKNKPFKITTYSNGYTVEKFILAPNEITIPWDQQEDTGIHFR